ncbi:MAG: tRNA epoxyqueuosine(34) reductase QueG, partial [Gammaproteobacteria bacterium]
YFFLGEIYTDIELPIDEPNTENHCGSCTSCIDICPTNAFVGPNQLDARKCISYLTIEYKGSIPEELRPKMGNRIFGCDDCQIFCPWNKFTHYTDEEDFLPRHKLDDIELCELFNWSEDDFLNKTEGSPIRRAGYESWLRNIAIALGNATYSKNILEVLSFRQDSSSAIVKEHVNWAIKEQQRKSNE